MTNTLTFSYSANMIEVDRSGDEMPASEQINAAIPTILPQERQAAPGRQG